MQQWRGRLPLSSTAIPPFYGLTSKHPMAKQPVRVQAWFLALHSLDPRYTPAQTMTCGLDPEKSKGGNCKLSENVLASHTSSKCDFGLDNEQSSLSGEKSRIGKSVHSENTKMMAEMIEKLGPDPGKPNSLRQVRQLHEVAAPECQRKTSVHFKRSSPTLVNFIYIAPRSACSGVE